MSLYILYKFDLAPKVSGYLLNIFKIVKESKMGHIKHVNSAMGGGRQGKHRH